MIRNWLSRALSLLPFRTFDRYLIRNFIFAWVVCTFSVFGLFIVIDGVTRIEQFLKEEDPLPLVALRYFAALLPVYFSQYIGPVLTLLAAMFSVSSLNKGNELTPLRVSGLSFGRILGSYFLMGLVAAIAMVVVQELVVPSLRDEIRIAKAYGRSKTAIQPDMIVDTLDSMIEVDRYLPHERRGEDVVIVSRHSSNSSAKERIGAMEILWQEPVGGDPFWLLRDGTIQRWDESGAQIPNPDSEGESVYLQRFHEMRLATDMRPIDLESSDREIPYLSFSELRDQYKRRSHLKHLEVKLHQRFAFPLANLILLLLGLPFLLRTENRSIVVGIVLAIGVSTLYLITTYICADLGTKGQLPPMLAGWLPILFFGALGLTLFDGLES